MFLHIMQNQYSNRGAEPRPPSCMLRSLLLMIAMNVVSVTHWVETLHTSQFFAVLSGFQPWDIPGVGTFYDFIDRLWNYATPNFSPHCKPPVRKKVKKPKEKGQKAAPIEKESVADLIIRLSQATFSTDGNPHDQLGSPRIIPTTTGYFLWVSTTLVCCALLFPFCRFFAPLLLLALPFLGLCRLFTAHSECTLLVLWNLREEYHVS